MDYNVVSETERSLRADSTFCCHCLQHQGRIPRSEHQLLFDVIIIRGVRCMVIALDNRKCQLAGQTHDMGGKSMKPYGRHNKSLSIAHWHA